MKMKTNRFIGWCAVGLLLVVAIYCEFKLGNPLGNAVLDIVLAVVVFYISYNDANKKNELQQNQIKELQKRIEQLEARDSNPSSSKEASVNNPMPSVDWKNAITR